MMQPLIELCNVGWPSYIT